jgi:beta-glucanase (GH16 family)
MSNFIKKFRFGLRSRFGLLPGTSRLEVRDAGLRQEYEEFIKYKESGEPKRFIELEELVTSQDFRDRKKYISSQRFKDTEAYQKLLEYNAMKNSPEFKGYLRFVTSKYFADFMKFDNSEEVKKLNAAGRSKDPEIEILGKSPGIKAYYKLSKSKDLPHFRRLYGSERLARFEALEKYINSEDYRETKEYMQSRDKFKKSREYEQLMEYRELKKSPRLKWYFKLKNSKKFSEIKKWKLEFYDEFEGNQLDREKWLTAFYWGKQLLSESYSLASDLHFYTDGNNHEIKDSTLRIHTRKEKVSGKAWDPAIGFYPKEFEYTTGLVNTGESFRQKYGAFEAKVRMHPSPSVYHTFWLLSDQMVPHIDIFRFSGNARKRIQFNSYSEMPEGPKKILKNTGEVGGPDFSRGYFIYRFEWYPDRMVWKINDTVVRTETENVPQEPMYLLFSSGVESSGDENGLPTSLDIDWVRCYSFLGES